MPEDAYASCRFYVEIGNIPQAIFTEVSGLQLELDVTDYQEGGNNNYVHRLPGRAKSSNLTLKRGMAKSNGFLSWLLDTAKGTITRQNVTVVMYYGDGQVLRRWTLEDAFPTKWVGAQLSASSTTAAVETLELAYSSLRVG